MQPFDSIPGIKEDRLLVFLENQEKGIFRQVLLTREQFKNVSDAIEVSRSEDQENLKPGMVIVDIALDDDREFPADLFIGCGSVNEENG